MITKAPCEIAAMTRDFLLTCSASRSSPNRPQRPHVSDGTGSFFTVPRSWSGGRAAESMRRLKPPCPHIYSHRVTCAGPCLGRQKGEPGELGELDHMCCGSHVLDLRSYDCWGWAVSLSLFQQLRVLQYVQTSCSIAELI